MLKKAKEIARQLANNGTQDGADSLTIFALERYFSCANIKQHGMNSLVKTLYAEFDAVKRDSMRLTTPQILLNYKPTLNSKPIDTCFYFDVVDGDARPGNYDIKIPVQLSSKKMLTGSAKKQAASIAATIFAASGKFANAKQELGSYFCTANLRKFGAAGLFKELQTALLATKTPVYEVRLILASLQFVNNGFELHTSTFEEGVRDGQGRYGGVDGLELPLDI